MRRSLSTILALVFLVLASLAVASPSLGQAVLAPPVIRFGWRVVIREVEEAGAARMAARERTVAAILEKQGARSVERRGLGFAEERAVASKSPANDNFVFAARRTAGQRVATVEAEGGSAIRSEDIISLCQENDAGKRQTSTQRLLKALTANALSLGANFDFKQDYSHDALEKILKIAKSSSTERIEIRRKSRTQCFET
jgi:hypothetical protein